MHSQDAIQCPTCEVRNGSIIKHLLKGFISTNVENIASQLEDIIVESINFVAACYGCRAGRQMSEI